ncbi:cytochrome b/b6 domain-containing protein [Erythrobacter sp. HL-111]|uniref:cytochrome b/b6 domain-containing protein n=1 Tax=Erythrobacter sp. HL-111 TaxID=1798193 RepID=UPI0006D98AC7|nr:cytochrome b/b6 domain-containing protein [Erythrobacter sp. HL-111]KPP90290.1 MAG: cytochrome b [Erythrobacteraceae bacterium HL-111]SDR84508.1 Cytochrome b [Erythrobacter sp. HL-111]
MDEPARAGPGAPPHRVRVWDPVVRLSHWSFVVLIPAMWWTAENSEWGWHKRLGLVLFGILVLRIAWGFLGPRTARFADFVRGPSSVLAYFRGNLPEGAQRVGHNPAGGYSTLALLLVMLAQASMGLFAGDPFDGMTGPLNPLVGVMTADTITDLHETFFWVVVAFIALHVAAILFYEAVQRERLVGAMVTGRRRVPPGGEGIGTLPRARALAAVLIAGGLAWWIAQGAPPLT